MERGAIDTGAITTAPRLALDANALLAYAKAHVPLPNSTSLAPPPPATPHASPHSRIEAAPYGFTILRGQQSPQEGGKAR